CARRFPDSPIARAAPRQFFPASSPPHSVSGGAFRATVASRRRPPDDPRPGWTYPHGRGERPGVGRRHGPHRGVRSAVAVAPPAVVSRPHMAADLSTLDATAQAELVRRGDATPRELVFSAIERIERVNPKLNAVITPLFEKA